VYQKIAMNVNKNSFVQNVKELHIPKFKLTDEKILELSQVLMSPNCSVETLVISTNSIGGKYYPEFEKGLRENESLKRLTLDGVEVVGS
jgi:hypothetical protein